MGWPSWTCLPQDWVEIEVRYPGGEAGKEVEAFLVRPREAGPFPCTVLLHGRGGWWQAYIRYAREMAARGFSALIMNYYSAHRVNLEGLNIPFEHRKRQFELQILDISSATRAFARSRNCTGGQVGLIGFSLGADKAFRVAAVNPEVRAIVSYYGPSDYVSLIRERINPLLLALADDETLRWKGYLEKNSPLALAPRVGGCGFAISRGEGRGYPNEPFRHHVQCPPQKGGGGRLPALSSTRALGTTSSFGAR